MISDIESTAKIVVPLRNISRSAQVLTPDVVSDLFEPTPNPFMPPELVFRFFDNISTSDQFLIDAGLIDPPPTPTGYECSRVMPDGTASNDVACTVDYDASGPFLSIDQLEVDDTGPFFAFTTIDGTALGVMSFQPEVDNRNMQAQALCVPAGDVGSRAFLALGSFDGALIQPLQPDTVSIKCFDAFSNTITVAMPGSDGQMRLVRLKPPDSNTAIFQYKLDGAGNTILVIDPVNGEYSLEQVAQALETQNQIAEGNHNLMLAIGQEEVTHPYSGLQPHISIPLAAVDHFPLANPPAVETVATPRESVVSPEPAAADIQPAASESIPPIVYDLPPLPEAGQLPTIIAANINFHNPERVEAKIVQETTGCTWLTNYKDMVNRGETQTALDKYWQENLTQPWWKDTWIDSFRGWFGVGSMDLGYTELDPTTSGSIAIQSIRHISFDSDHNRLRLTGFTNNQLISLNLALTGKTTVVSDGTSVTFLADSEPVLSIALGQADANGQSNPGVQSLLTSLIAEAGTGQEMDGWIGAAGANQGTFASEKEGLVLRYRAAQSSTYMTNLILTDRNGAMIPIPNFFLFPGMRIEDLEEITFVDGQPVIRVQGSVLDLTHAQVEALVNQTYDRGLYIDRAEMHFELPLNMLVTDADTPPTPAP